MSKISEQKALEAYPIKIDRIYYGLPLINGAEPFTDDVNIHQRNAYIKGYDQAIKDFQEKACTFLKNRTMAELCLNSESTELVDDFIEQFKNYMQDEK